MSSLIICPKCGRELATVVSKAVRPTNLPNRTHLQAFACTKCGSVISVQMTTTSALERAFHELSIRRCR